MKVISNNVEVSGKNTCHKVVMDNGQWFKTWSWLYTGDAKSVKTIIDSLKVGVEVDITFEERVNKTTSGKEFRNGVITSIHVLNHTLDKTSESVGEYTPDVSMSKEESIPEWATETIPLESTEDFISTEELDYSGMFANYEQYVSMNVQGVH